MVWHSTRLYIEIGNISFVGKNCLIVEENVNKYLLSDHRPDLVDWRNVKSKNVRERLESAFYIAEREYGVTRLLDPEGKCALQFATLN